MSVPIGSGGPRGRSPADSPLSVTRCWIFYLREFAGAASAGLLISIAFDTAVFKRKSRACEHRLEMNWRAAELTPEWGARGSNAHSAQVSRNVGFGTGATDAKKPPRGRLECTIKDSW